MSAVKIDLAHERHLDEDQWFVDQRRAGRVHQVTLSDGPKRS